MMAPTHVLVGVVLAAAYSSVDPSSTVLVVAAGAVGGLFPDLDMCCTHRKTLHYPVLFSAATVAAGAVAVVVPAPATAALLVALAAASAHSLMDILGGGKELRPWQETDDRAVFDHVSGAWITARRVAYDGSVPDLATTLVSAVVAAVLLPRAYYPPVASVVAVGVVYALLRRWIAKRIPGEYETFSSYLQDGFP